MITKRKPSKTTSKKVATKTTTASKAWSKKDDSALIKALNAGHSAVETAAILGRTVSAVWNRKFNLKATFKSAAKKSFRNHQLPMAVKASSKKATIAKKSTGKVSATSKPVAKKSTSKTSSVKAKTTTKKSTSKKSTSKKK